MKMMRTERYIYYIIGVILLTACGEFELSDNGHLDGFWQLSTVDTLQTGRSADLRADGLTWSFLDALLELRDTRKVHQDIIMDFQHTGGQLRLSAPYLVDRDAGDIVIEDIGLLQPYGILAREEVFRVVELTSGKMVLESDLLRLHFRKY